jgi:hypothetical protein
LHFARITWRSGCLFRFRFAPAQARGSRTFFRSGRALAAAMRVLRYGYVQDGDVICKSLQASPRPLVELSWLWTLRGAFRTEPPSLEPSHGPCNVTKSQVCVPDCERAPLTAVVKESVKDTGVSVCFAWVGATACRRGTRAVTGETIKSWMRRVAQQIVDSASYCRRPFCVFCASDVRRACVYSQSSPPLYCTMWLRFPNVMEISPSSLRPRSQTDIRCLVSINESAGGRCKGNAPVGRRICHCLSGRRGWQVADHLPRRERALAAQV